MGAVPLREGESAAELRAPAAAAKDAKQWNVLLSPAASAMASTARRQRGAHAIKPTAVRPPPRGSVTPAVVSPLDAEVLFMQPEPPLLASSLNLSSIRLSIGSEQSIPEETDHREIAVRMPVMNEV